MTRTCGRCATPMMSRYCANCRTDSKTIPTRFSKNLTPAKAISAAITIVAGISAFVVPLAGWLLAVAALGYFVFSLRKNDAA